MRSETLATGTLLALLFVASSAEAQVSADEMTRGRPERLMTIRGMATVMYDSNVNRVSPIEPLRRILSKDDVIYTPGVSADIVQPVGQQSVFLRGTANYLFHDKNTNLDSGQFDVSGGAGGRLGPCGAVATGGYTRGRSQLDDVSLSETINNILERERIGAAFTCVRAPGIGIQAAANREWTHNSLATTKLSNAETTSGSAGIIFGRPSQSSIGLNGGYSRTEYPNRLTVNGKKDGFEVYSAGVTAERQLGARIQGTVSVGYSRAEPFSIPAPVPGSPLVANSKFEGLTYSANIVYRVSSRLRTEASLKREIAPTLVQGQGYEVQSSYSVGANYRIGERLALGLRAIQNESNTRGRTIVASGPIGQTKALVRSYSGDITYTQSRRLSFILTGSYTERNSDNPLFEYDGARIGLTTNFTY